MYLKIFNQKEPSWLHSIAGFGEIDLLDTSDQILMAYYWSFGTLTMMNFGRK